MPSAVWQGWSDSLFSEARRTNKLVLLDLEAVWCHWCHVMDKTTYRDERVTNILTKRYIAVKVDQDARPDLSLRYEEYGWPATIIFDGNGRELAKLSGYQEADEFSTLLEQLAKNPKPLPEASAAKPRIVAASSTLSPKLFKELEKKHFQRYDWQYGGWGRIHKFLQSENIEYTMRQAAEGNKRAQQMARQTLDLQFRLFDKVWGGVYQYSHGGVWTNPHFEKIMSVQAANMRIYSLAALQWNEPRYIYAAERIAAYLRDFLQSPDGAFYTSQDADIVQGKHSERYFALGDKARRKRGVPRIDTHIYARENGWVIEALCVLGGASGKNEYIRAAERAAEWIIRHRGLQTGGFRHDEADTAAYYLGDQIAMAKALLALYETTAKRAWLEQAIQTTRYIHQRFTHYIKGDTTAVGFVSAVLPSGSPFAPVLHRDENIDVTRFTNLLWYYSGQTLHRTMAETAMRYLANEEVALDGRPAGILLADAELHNEPAHIVVVGAKTNDIARTLMSAALQYPSNFRRIEWWDASEGNLPNHDVEYPKLPFAAAFICANKRCSLPITQRSKLITTLKKFHQTKTP